MARTGRPKAELTLSEVERQTLQRWTRRAKTAQALALRARVVLACAEGASNKDVAVSLGVSEATVGKWRRRFVGERLDGLADADRPGRPRTIRDEQVEKVVVDTLEAAPPDGGTHWSTRLMATRTGMTQTAVSRIWRAFGLKPHKVNYWKLSTDPHFIDKLYDVVGLYLNPPERAIVLCADEKSNIQALNRSAPVLAMMPADAARQTHDYIRNGTSSLFAALDVATGKVISHMRRRHRASEFKKFLNQIDREVPAMPGGCCRPRWRRCWRTRCSAPAAAARDRRRRAAVTSRGRLGVSCVRRRACAAAPPRRRAAGRSSP
jgi:transposase